MNRNDLNAFEKLVGQIESTYDELSILSKKAPNDALNSFKLGLVNRLLEQSNRFLGKKYVPFDDFGVFSEDDVPQNSDVVFVLSQYLQCFEKFRADHVVKQLGNWYWSLEPGKDDEADESGRVLVESTMPKRLRN